ncbi:hypothetical protein ACFVYP_38260 [Kitasatospora sp. NPDC058201]|uniref:hypothetical protein n=1 Tax=unclassified Kitasatospora TaxID=2633591 RepID=UPI003646FDCB
MRVPARLPYDRYPPDTTDPDSVLLHRSRWIRAGAEFEPAVTDLPEPDGEHMVAGVLVAPHSRVRVELTDDQAAELGLSPGAQLPERQQAAVRQAREGQRQRHRPVCTRCRAKFSDERWAEQEQADTWDDDGLFAGCRGRR